MPDHLVPKNAREFVAVGSRHSGMAARCEFRVLERDPRGTLHATPRAMSIPMVHLGEMIAALQNVQREALAKNATLAGRQASDAGSSRPTASHAVRHELSAGLSTANAICVSLSSAFLT